MEDEQNERRIKWKTTKMEDDQNRRRTKCKTRESKGHRQKPEIKFGLRVKY